MIPVRYFRHTSGRVRVSISGRAFELAHGYTEVQVVPLDAIVIDPARVSATDVTDPANIVPLVTAPVVTDGDGGHFSHVHWGFNSLVSLDAAEQEALDAARDAVVNAAAEFVAVLTHKDDRHESTTKSVEHLVLTVRALTEVTP